MQNTLPENSANRLFEQYALQCFYSSSGAELLTIAKISTRQTKYVYLESLQAQKL